MNSERNINGDNDLHLVFYRDDWAATPTKSARVGNNNPPGFECLLRSRPGTRTVRKIDFTNRLATYRFGEEI
jgi:hypothetical protein